MKTNQNGVSSPTKTNLNEMQKQVEFLMQEMNELEKLEKKLWQSERVDNELCLKNLLNYYEGAISKDDAHSKITIILSDFYSKKGDRRNLHARRQRLNDLLYKLTHVIDDMYSTPANFNIIPIQVELTKDNVEVETQKLQDRLNELDRMERVSLDHQKTEDDKWLELIKDYKVGKINIQNVIEEADIMDDHYIGNAEFSIRIEDEKNEFYPIFYKHIRNLRDEFKIYKNGK